ncbi:MAG: MBOAT family O-acyltransferase, partial [Planctomycetota bacterium]
VWPRRDALRMLARGLIEITLGGLLVAWAFASPWPASLRIVEHLVKLTAGYLAVFDGGFVTLTGLCALLEGRALLQSNHPVLAVTPADFWRRYNMEAGRYFRECVFRPVGGLRRPVVGVLATFAVNGAFHEYLASMLVGEVRGYQLAFFAIQGTAVAVTLRWRPRGRAAVLSWVFTLLLMASSSVLFCLSLRGFIDVYP